VRSRELRLAIMAAIVLVIVRSIVPVAYEQLDFDSDQAIVGLMAKHLSEFREFPLFFYGQNYMLGVQAWIAAPFFWVGGPTVTMLRTPLLLINVAVAVLLVVMIARRGVRGWLAFVATLPFIVASPILAAELYSTLGASVEPLLYVIVLWILRDRPIAFGVVLCIGALHREFTIFALPALAAVYLIERRPVNWRAIGRAAIGFAVVWLVVDILKHWQQAGSLAQEAQMISRWVSIDAGYPARLWSLIMGLPILFGGRHINLDHYSLNSTIGAGSALAGVMLAIALAISAVRLAWITSDRTQRTRLAGGSFLLYLALVALAALAAYGLNPGIDPEATPLFRYVLLLVLLPVATLGGFFLAERSRALNASVICAVAVWAAFTVRDNVGLIREYRSAPPVNEFRQLADYLVAHKIEYGYAQYWDCYIVDFLSRERVILASTDFLRVPAYQTLVEAHASTAASIERVPCTTGTHFASWCIDDPLKR
jgi:hypothetical protein